MPLMKLIRSPGKIVRIKDPQTLVHDPSAHECNPYKTTKDKLIENAFLATGKVIDQFHRANKKLKVSYGSGE